MGVQTSFANTSINLDSVGKRKLTLPNGIEVSIVDFDKEESNGNLFWKSKLLIKEDGKTIIERYPIIEDYEGNYFFYLVPIKKGKYLMDLDKNQDFEFAVAVDHGGNAPTTSATVFSLKGSKLHIYKHAWYQQEGGQEVIWDYDKAPKKCLYTSPGVCEFL